MMDEKILELASLNFARAQILRSRLESEGIECFLTNINLLQSDIASGVKVFVRESDLRKALKIMSDMQSESGDDQREDLKYALQLRRLLVPVDFSVNSERACLFAIGLAEQLKAEVQLLHAYYNPAALAVPFNETFTYQVDMEQYLGEMEANSRKEMERLQKFLEEELRIRKVQHVQIKVTLAHGIAEDVILETAKEYQPAVIIMGTRGKGGAVHPLLGSVTTIVMEKAGFPVLAIPEDSPVDNITSINNIAYCTDFGESDIIALHRLMSIISPFHMKLFCVHVGSEASESWDTARLDFLRETISKQFKDFRISCALIRDDNILEGLERFILDNDIGILAVTTHRRNLISRLLKPSLARKLLYQAQIPLLAFHE